MEEILKEIFGDEALTCEQLLERLQNNDSIKLVNVADGSFVPKSELDAAKEDGANALTAYKLETEISKALATANSVDEVSVRANLNLEGVTLGEDGQLAGLQEQLDSLKKTKPFLFKEPEKILDLGSSTPGIKGAKEVKGIGAAVADFYKED